MNMLYIRILKFVSLLHFVRAYFT